MLCLIDAVLLAPICSPFHGWLGLSSPLGSRVLVDEDILCRTPVLSPWGPFNSCPELSSASELLWPLDDGLGRSPFSLWVAAIEVEPGPRALAPFLATDDMIVLCISFHHSWPRTLMTRPLVLCHWLVKVAQQVLSCVLKVLEGHCIHGCWSVGRS